MKNEFDEKWLQEKAVISREELGNIIATEISAVLTAVDHVFGDDDDSPAEMLKELLTTVGASIATKVFGKGKR